MLTWLFRIATVVTLVFALVAALTTTGLCLGEDFSVWLACGLLAGFFALFFAPWCDKKLSAAKTPPQPPPVVT
jgi:preprotein translocase subunit SecF